MDIPRSVRNARTRAPILVADSLFLFMLLTVSVSASFWKQGVLTSGSVGATIGSMNNTTYLAKLIQRQLDEGWSDREMARQLKVGNATWCRIKSGSRGMGVSFLRCAMQRFPEYDADALFFLRENASVGSDSYVGEKHRAT